MKKIVVIGAGFAGLSAAACLAKAGMDVTVVEKNETAGGRARAFSANGYRFDMGPSWYWMPDVFEKFFSRFGKKTSDYYSLLKLDPSYRVFFPGDDVFDLPSGENAMIDFFDRIETGSGQRLQQFIADGKFKYDTGMKELVYKPGLSLKELLDIRLVKALFKLDILQSVTTSAKKLFRDRRLVQLLEFPALFLGAPASRTPALYTLMNYADIALGTWYPAGGMYNIIEGMLSVAVSQGAKIRYNAEVKDFLMRENSIKSIKVNGEELPFDYVVASADYHHIEQNILPKKFRRYSKKYWDDRVMAPSCLIFYLGVRTRLKNLQHHNLFFDKDFEAHADAIYDHPRWPDEPLFYVCCTSITDPTTAPAGHENLFILMPVAPGLEDTEAIRKNYFDKIMVRLEQRTGQDIRQHIDYSRSYALSDFTADYHAFRGNAYGLANTLNQTAVLKPSIENKKVKNLFYTGQLTVPGPGMPPSIISGQVVADELIKRINSDSLALD